MVLLFGIWVAWTTLAYPQDPITVAEPNTVVEPNDVGTTEPNIVEPNLPKLDSPFSGISKPVNDIPTPVGPRRIVMPKGTRMPPKFKCPRHGLIGENVLILEIEKAKTTFCKRCALKLVIDIFNENLPKLEVVNANP
jgi:hypothetical protein